MTSTFVASVKKRRLCPALNGGAIIFRSASFAHFIVARRDEVVDRARALRSLLLITAKLSCSHSQSRVRVRDCCANRPRGGEERRRFGEMRGDDENRRQIQIDSFHLPTPPTRSVGRFAQRDWHCKGDKEGKKERKEKEESFVQSNVQFSSTYPLFNRKGVQGVVEAFWTGKSSFCPIPAHLLSCS